MADIIEKFGNSVVHHGKLSNRAFLLKLDERNIESVIQELDELAFENGYTKIVTYIKADDYPEFKVNGYEVEAFIPGFFNGKNDCVIASKFLDEKRSRLPEKQLETFSVLFNKKSGKGELNGLGKLKICKLGESDSEEIAKVLKQVFITYPVPVHNPDYVRRQIQNDRVVYYGVWDRQNLAGVSAADMDYECRNAEMTDFAILPEYRGRKLAMHLLDVMERQIKAEGIKTAYSIARLAEPGMNKTFLNCGYKYSGTLVKNTNIAGRIESMNIFYKQL